MDAPSGAHTRFVAVSAELSVTVKRIAVNAPSFRRLPALGRVVATAAVRFVHSLLDRKPFGIVLPVQRKFRHHQALMKRVSIETTPRRRPQAIAGAKRDEYCQRPTPASAAREPALADPPRTPVSALAAKSHGCWTVASAESPRSHARGSPQCDAGNRTFEAQLVSSRGFVPRHEIDAVLVLGQRTA